MPQDRSISVDDPFDAAFERYGDLKQEKYHVHHFSSIAYPDISIFRWEGLNPDWFGLGIDDLPMVIDKLEAGAPPGYTMSLIMLITKSDVGIVPGDSWLLDDWVRAFNALNADVADRVKQRDVKALGYLALHTMRTELEKGEDASLVALLPDAADGLKGADKSITTDWDRTQWLSWFECNAETLNVLESVTQRPINMPWLD